MQTHSSRMLYIKNVIDPKDIGKVLPWVHIAISNAKTQLADMHHGNKPEFLQEYLNEFCYKFNRRYFGEVHSHAPVDSYEEKHISSRVAEADRAQTLSTLLGTDAQTTLCDG